MFHLQPIVFISFFFEFADFKYQFLVFCKIVFFTGRRVYLIPCALEHSRSLGYQAVNSFVFLVNPARGCKWECASAHKSVYSVNYGSCRAWCHCVMCACRVCIPGESTGHTGKQREREGVSACARTLVEEKGRGVDWTDGRTDGLTDGRTHA